jgi:hypothetical protein
VSEREGGREASWWIIKREEEKTGAGEAKQHYFPSATITFVGLSKSHRKIGNFRRLVWTDIRYVTFIGLKECR